MPDDARPVVAPAIDVKTLNLHQRLLLVMEEVDYVQKDRTIGSGNSGYKVVTHDAVTAKVRPSLVKHRVLYYPQNLHYVQSGNRTEIAVDIRFVNADKPEDCILVPTLGFGIDNQDKGPGKAISYAVKMALLKSLGLETGLDADDNSNMNHEPDKGPANTSEFITPDQEKQISALILETKADAKKFLDYLGARAIYEIPASQFGQAINALEVKKKKVLS